MDDLPLKDDEVFDPHELPFSHPGRHGPSKISHAAIPLIAEAQQVERAPILACWLHGHSLRFYVSNEDMPKNSETSCDATARALSDAFTEVGSLPLTLYVQHDGTYREAKNQFYMSFLLVLTVLQVFRQCYISFLRPGHSHEDVDQIFSQVSGMLSSQTFSNPDELVDLLNLTCQPDTRAQSLRQKKRRLDRVAASSCRLDQTAQWKEWVAVAGVKLKGLRLLLIRK